MHKSIMQHGKAECRFLRCLAEFGGGVEREICFAMFVFYTVSSSNI